MNTNLWGKCGLVWVGGQQPMNLLSEISIKSRLVGLPSILVLEPTCAVTALIGRLPVSFVFQTDDGYPFAQDRCNLKSSDYILVCGKEKMNSDGGKYEDYKYKEAALWTHTASCEPRRTMKRGIEQ